MSRAIADILPYLNGESWRDGVFYDHEDSATTEKSGEMFCPAGVTTNFLRVPLRYKSGYGSYTTVQIFGFGISSSGGNSECLSFTRGALFNVNKDGTTRITNMYSGSSGASGALTFTIATTTSGLTGSNPPIGNVSINPNRDVWLSYNCQILFSGEF